MLQRMRGGGTWLLIGVTALAVLGWNWSRFVAAKPTIISKDLTFLPHPDVARLLSMGHAQTAAKLRWIDSFAYFQFLLEQEQSNDHVSGSSGKGGMERLYDMLIELDPKFEPFYEHALLNLGGILRRNHVALGYMQRATDELPHSMSMWRNLAAVLCTDFRWEERQPEAFAQLLSNWAAQAPDEESRRDVWQWKAKMGQRQRLGLAEVEYWRDQLSAVARGSLYEEFLTTTARESAARLAVSRLQHIVASASAAGHTMSDIGETVDVRWLRSAYPHGLPAYTPITATGALALDPFGLPFVLKRGATSSTVVSTGMYRLHIERLASGQSTLLAGLAAKAGRWPADVAEAVRWLPRLPAQPEDGLWTWHDQRVDVTWTTPPGVPWNLRK